MEESSKIKSYAPSIANIYVDIKKTFFIVISEAWLFIKWTDPSGLPQREHSKNIIFHNNWYLFYFLLKFISMFFKICPFIIFESIYYIIFYENIKFNGHKNVFSVISIINFIEVSLKFRNPKGFNCFREINTYHQKHTF